MTNRRNTDEGTPTPTASRSGGWQWPDLGWLLKRLTGFAGGCLTIVAVCLLGLVLAGWWGWSAITDAQPARPHRPAYTATTHDPLGCGQRGEWVVSWDTAQGKRYACTPAWK